LTRVKTPSVSSTRGLIRDARLTPDLGFAPQTETRTRQDTKTKRCKPCKKCREEEDTPRDECFKGLYRENALETEFTQWVEIDCLTGREL